MRSFGFHRIFASLLLAPVFAGLAAAEPEWPPTEARAEIPRMRPVRTPRSVRPTPISDGRWRVAFRINDPDAEGMSLAGSFNGWNPSANRMQQDAEGGWSTVIFLPDGVHQYKFVADQDRWLSDPINEEGVPDGHGGRNSIFTLGVEALFDPADAVRGDGRILGAALLHDPADWKDVQPLPDDRIRLSVRTLRGDLEGSEVAFEDGSRIPLEAGGGTDRFERWGVDLPADRNGLEYTFLFKDGNTRVRHPRIFTMDRSAAPDVRTPDWAKHATWYQVMVERFRDGDSTNDPDPSRPWTAPWYEPSPWEGADGQTFYEYFIFDRHYGGDLQGLKQKLPYLKDLGVDAIYLNPVFQAATHHKYDATDYRHIDQHFGAGGDDFEKTIAREDLADPSTWTWSESDLVFLDFLKEAKSLGFRVILDGVFNHVGTAHPAFRDVRERGVESPFADWFSIRSWEPFEYDGWAGFGELPAFRKSPEHGLASRTLRDHIFEVTRRWMDPDGDGDPSDGIDGWRLDVPEEVPMSFWVEWCDHVRSINPEAFIVGEIWKARPEWLDGRTFDAVMNYPFAEIAFDWIAQRERKITASEAARRFEEHRGVYPAEVTYALQNLVDSHDTDRMVSKIHNPDRAFDSGNREQDDPTYDGTKPPPVAYARARLIALLQMTYPGAPMVYYGDEAGMWGSDDPNNRKPMLWEDLEPYEEPGQSVMREHLAFYRDAIALRKAHPALRTGSFTTILTDDEQDVMAFVREDDSEEVLVVLNAGEDEARISLPVSTEGWKPVFGGTDTPGFPEVDPGNDALPDVTVPGISGRAWTRSK
ncbi:MAG: DUF3459 domain-containing protein [Phycisphaera sp.]|nr:DUF3459 domain-containing protein [Phycisphaera sp.]